MDNNLINLLLGAVIAFPALLCAFLLGRQNYAKRIEQLSRAVEKIAEKIEQQPRYNSNGGQMVVELSENVKANTGMFQYCRDQAKFHKSQAETQLSISQGWDEKAEFYAARVQAEADVTQKQLGR